MFKPHFWSSCLSSATNGFSMLCKFSRRKPLNGNIQLECRLSFRRGSQQGHPSSSTNPRFWDRTRRTKSKGDSKKSDLVLQHRQLKALDHQLRHANSTSTTSITGQIRPSIGAANSGTGAGALPYQSTFVHSVFDKVPFS